MKDNTTYEDVLEELLHYFNPCRKDQLRRALTKCFDDVDDDKAEEILLAYQLKGHVLFSKDGWAMTKGEYVDITGDTKTAKIDYSNDVRLPNMDKYITDKRTKKLIDCLWVLVDMLPDSLDFVLTNKPFQLTFFAGNKLYEVLEIPAAEEDLRIEMLKQMPADSFDDMKKAVKRVAIMENPDHAWKVPEHIGFKFIVTLDKLTPSHYRVVDKRVENW